MASPVLSVQKHTLTISGGASTAAQADLTDAPDITNCIPFVSTRVVTTGSSADSFSAYAVRADFVDDTTDKVRVTTSSQDLGSREIVCEVTVVEFDPTEVNVYQGSGTFDNDEVLTIDDPYGDSIDVVLAKSFLYFTYSTTSGNETWRQAAIRGVVTDVDTLTFDAIENQGPTPNTSVYWYVAEAINTAWAVDHVAIQLTATDTTITDTFTAVDDAKTFILGSYKGSDGSADSDGNKQNTIDVELEESDPGTSGFDTVRATRLTASGIIDWAGFVVKLAGGENVYRGQLTTSGSSPDTQAHGETLTLADCMVHTCGMTGMLGGSGNDDSNSTDPVHCFYGWTLDATNVICAHNTGATFEAADVTWEVIEWDVGGAAAPRRVMVVS